MAEIEIELNRDRATIRTWEAKGWLPDELKFKRDEANWRYWTREQLVLAREWMASRNQGRSKPRQRRQAAA